ncbi:MAG TPA: TonB-dependent receptor plug domain-containing protein, partial [Gemmatimonadales bacterium]|nr:TonB-dependent receptor plug domain-containing protein [Gemmatimonadales bacterium]
RRLGYAPSISRVEVVPGLDHEMSVALEPLPFRLDSLTVTAEPGGIAIGGGELARRGRDLGRALDGWEGVVVRRTGSGGPAAPQLRGGGPDEVLVLVDGFALNDPLTGRADLSIISTGDVERVTLVPGMQTARGGSRAVAGILMVETRRAPRPEGGGWVGSHGTWGARAAGAAGPVAIALTGERHASDFGYDVPEVRGGGRAERRNAGGRLYGVTARLDGPVRVLFRGTASDRGLPGTTTNPTPAARASDRTAFLGARAGRSLRWYGSLQWLETRAADSAPPTGTAYDAYTHGTGIHGGVEYGDRIARGGWTGQASVAAEARGDRFGGDGVRPGASFTHLSLRAGGAVPRGRRTVWSLAPMLRLDGWTGSDDPGASLRLDAGVQRGRSSATLGFGSGVTPPVLADLLFREGVGVRLNPDLRPERVPWELEAGVRRELPGRGAVALRGFHGHVSDLIVWAPDFRFIWSPRNFDVVRRGGEATLTILPTATLRVDAALAYSAVTYDRPDGAQVQYRPRVTYAASAGWSPGEWTLDLRWRRIGQRFPNASGTNPRAPIELVDLAVQRRLAPELTARAEARDLGDTGAEFIAGYPTPGRTFTLSLELTLP